MFARFGITKDALVMGVAVGGLIAAAVGLSYMSKLSSRKAANAGNGRGGPQGSGRREPAMSLEEEMEQRIQAYQLEIDALVVDVAVAVEQTSLFEASPSPALLTKITDGVQQIEDSLMNVLLKVDDLHNSVKPRRKALVARIVAALADLDHCRGVTQAHSASS